MPCTPWLLALTQDGASTPAAVRYLEKFSMEVTLQASTSQNNEGRIYPPAVRIRYASRDPSIRGTGVVNPAEFSVHYSQSEVRHARAGAAGHHGCWLAGSLSILSSKQPGD